MRIFNLAILNIKNHVYKAYQNNNKSNEAAYAAYRTITRADIKESWHVVKPWIREWEGKA